MEMYLIRTLWFTLGCVLVPVVACPIGGCSEKCVDCVCGICMQCRPGFFLEDTTCRKCSTTCRHSDCLNTLGYCAGCHTGWHGPKCENKCPHCPLGCGQFTGSCIRPDNADYEAGLNYSIGNPEPGASNWTTSVILSILGGFSMILVMLLGLKFMLKRRYKPGQFSMITVEGRRDRVADPEVRPAHGDERQAMITDSLCGLPDGVVDTPPPYQSLFPRTEDTRDVHA